MPIWDHLEELRERVLVGLLAAGVAIGGCFCFSKELVLFLEAPVADAGVRFLQLSPGEFFFTTFKVSSAAHRMRLSVNIYRQLRLSVCSGSNVQFVGCLHRMPYPRNASSRPACASDAANATMCCCRLLATRVCCWLLPLCCMRSSPMWSPA